MLKSLSSIRLIDHLCKNLARVVACSLIVLSISACSSDAAKDSSATSDDGGPETSVTDSSSAVEPSTKSTQDFQPELWPERQPSPPLFDEIEQRVSSLLARMSVEEKVGQILQPELKYVTPEDVKQYHLGSILNGGGTTPNNDKYASVMDWATMAESFYQASMDESDGRVGIPIIWGSDAVHGNNNVFGATVFPHNIGLGAANDSEMVRRIGQATALELAITGVDWTFGPTVAVVRDIRWGRTYESYSEDPNIVMAYASEMVRGIQGDKLTPGEYQARHVVATAKHFIGDGGTTQGIDRGDTAVSEQELIEIHGAGYFSALEGNVMTTMASFNSWNGVKVHGHRYLMTDILKQRLGFNGFIVSDWNGHMQVPGCTVKNCAAAINAGLDLVMVPSDWKDLYSNTLAAVKSGEISMQRLDDAVTRILRIKHMAGLFEAGPILQRPLVGEADWLGHEDHRKLAREAVRKSLVLLKNTQQLLPISPKSNILVAGDAADNIAKAAGGWTLTWQGTGNKNADFPNGTSIYKGLQSAVTAAGGKLVLSSDGAFSESDFNGETPDVAIVVFGEEPYAEWHGDITNIEYQYNDKRDLALLRELKGRGIPVVSVFISGRPLWVNKELNSSDAFVAAWLPGTEGSGVADVLLRKADDSINHDFQGKLSFSWPKTVSQAVLNVGDKGYDPLFPHGYGLTYASSKQISNQLNESTERLASDELEETWMFVSREMSEYEFRLQDQGAEAVVVNGNRVVSGEDENVLLMSVDKVAQEDARRLRFKGLRPATVSLAAKRPQDFSQYQNSNAALSFAMKVDSAPSGAVSLTMMCGGKCGKPLELKDALTTAPIGRYQDYRFELACFMNEASGLDHLESAFSLRSEGALDLAIADIKVSPITEGQQVMSCD